MNGQNMYNVHVFHGMYKYWVGMTGYFGLFEKKSKHFELPLLISTSVMTHDLLVGIELDFRFFNPIWQIR